MNFLSDAGSVVRFPRNLLDERVFDLPDWILDLLPIGVHICDRDGTIVRYNRGAAEIWARSPKPGDPAERFSGSYRLRRVDGSELPREEHPAAEALRTGTSVLNHIMVCERPDGSRVSLLVNAHALKDALGNVIGAINCSQDITSFKRMQTLLHESERQSRGMLEALPVAVYATDPEGRITFFNQAAVDLWGRRPDIGQSVWCGSWKLYHLDGRPMPHDECPMALALKEGRTIDGAEAVAERPDGTRIAFRAYPTPLFDEAGRIVGGLNTLMDVTERRRTEEIRQRLVSIVESSQDAIVGKDLNGTIISWNHGAAQLFGYTPEEVIGKSVTILMPADHINEEPEILARIRRGEKIDHYETVRQRKDGSLIDISLMVSPIRNAEGVIIGASKIARDITERRRAEEQRRLVLREMNHRVKNLFSLASGVVTLSARSAETPAGLAAAVRERLTALARAHDLTLPDLAASASSSGKATTLYALIRTIVSPFEDTQAGGASATATGPDVTIGGSAVTSLALLLHEFATNAAKYGAFSMPTGHVDIRWSLEEGELLLTWEEQGGPQFEPPPDDEQAGFGTLLCRRIVSGQIGGRIAHQWNPHWPGHKSHTAVGGFVGLIKPPAIAAVS